MDAKFDIKFTTQIQLRTQYPSKSRKISTNHLKTPKPIFIITNANSTSNAACSALYKSNENSTAEFERDPYLKFLQTQKFIRNNKSFDSTSNIPKNIMFLNSCKNYSPIRSRQSFSKNATFIKKISNSRNTRIMLKSRPNNQLNKNNKTELSIKQKQTIIPENSMQISKINVSSKNDLTKVKNKRSKSGIDFVGSRTVMLIPKKKIMPFKNRHKAKKNLNSIGDDEIKPNSLKISKIQTNPNSNYSIDNPKKAKSVVKKDIEIQCENVKIEYKGNFFKYKELMKLIYNVSKSNIKHYQISKKMYPSVKMKRQRMSRFHNLK